MPIDGFTLGFVAKELDVLLTGGRIDKIVQPEKDELILTVRNNGTNYQLLLSASAGCARAHLTSIKKANPLEPPVLCMLMRKHVIGGRIQTVKTLECDRILEIDIEHFDELGDRVTKKLICEFMGKHSNLIFIGGDGRIIDSARRVNEAISSVREVLPGLRYEMPPAHGKLNYDTVTSESLYTAMGDMGGKVAKVIAQTISGMSSQTARELALRSTGDAEAHTDTQDRKALSGKVTEQLTACTGMFAPSVYYDEDGTAIDATAFEYQSYSHLRREPYATLSEALDAFFQTRDISERISQKSAALHRTLKKNIERCEKKLAIQEQEILDSARMEEYRIKGELLKANSYKLARGAKFADVPNYYEEDMPLLRIELDEKLSPVQNAQRYFKLYQKAHNARTLAAEQMEKTREELDYLEGQMDNLSKCTTESELAELREELEKLGYVKVNRNRRQLKQLPPSTPLKFTSPTGFPILVGKNNFQNDKLTASAQPNEIWLHVKNIPGSHVIIVGENPDDETIAYAARLAATYSSGKTSSRVQVDYTYKRFVKKPAGAKPGFVIYTNQHTLNVQPLAQPTQD